MALQKAVGFHQDTQADWVVELACGHSQHVRHRPPFENRAWVSSEVGRNTKLGAPFDCNFCDMPELPATARVYRSTKLFDRASVPEALLEQHRTRIGIWGRITVDAGLVKYQVLEPERRVWILRPGVVGIIAPEQAHALEPVGTARFYLEFLRVLERSG